MNNVYHPDIYQFNKPVPSYWEATSSENLNLDKLQKDISSEIVVIGAGTTLHRTAAGVIRTGISTLGPTGFVGGRGGWLVTERFKKKTKSDIKTSSNVTS